MTVAVLEDIMRVISFGGHGILLTNLAQIDIAIRTLVMALLGGIEACYLSLTIFQHTPHHILEHEGAIRAIFFL